MRDAHHPSDPRDAPDPRAATPPTAAAPVIGGRRVPDRGGRRLRAALALPLLAAAVALPGCGGGDATRAELRLVNAGIAYPALDLVVGDRVVQAGVAYGDRAAYAAVDAGGADLRIARAGSPAALASLSARLSERRHYSLVAHGGEGTLRATLLDEGASAPDRGKASLRVLHGAADAGAIDLYLTAPEVALADAEPLFASAAAGATTGFMTVDAASWRLRVTAAGKRDDLRLDLNPVALASRQEATLVVTPSAGGVLVGALLLMQGGAIDRLDGAHARVRAVAGVTASASVAASVGGVVLIDGVGAPAIGPYRLVPAGAAAATLNVDGAAVDVPATTLAPGTDHTLLVRGTPAAPLASWIADDNRPPVLAGSARLRLLNGLADLAEPLSMTLDFTPVASGVAPGTASAPVRVDASTGARIAVSAPGFGTPLYTVEDRPLAGGGVYTVFVLGAADAAQGIPYRDR